MLEDGPSLRTWALDEEPRPGAAIAAWELPDHRHHYLDYEGPVSGNRGHVTRWDRGSFSTLERTADGWRVVLQGSRIRGRLTLTRADPPPQRWTAEFADSAAT
jgi:hypothetical protein